jgi:glycine dehydrogenase subunit 1
MSRLVPGEARLRDLIVVASTEMNTPQDREAYARALREVLP